MRKKDRFGIEEIFEEFLKQMRQLDELMEKEFMDMGEPKRYVRGISIKIGPDGKPIVREFGNKVVEKEKIEDEIEPLVDVIDEKDIVRVIAEVPGVSEEDIEIKKTEEGIEIISKGAKKYHKRIKINSPVNFEKMTKTCKNGILEIKLPKN